MGYKKASQWSRVHAMQVLLLLQKFSANLKGGSEDVKLVNIFTS
jgi:hypothetical protein